MNSLSARGISWPTRTLNFSGLIEQRGGFVLFYSLNLDPRFMGINLTSVTAESFASTMTADSQNDKFTSIAKWYLSFAHSLAGSILNEKPSSEQLAAPGPISSYLRNAWMNYAEGTVLALRNLAIDSNVTASKPATQLTQSAQRNKDTPESERNKLVIDTEVKLREEQQRRLDAWIMEQAQTAQDALRKKEKDRLTSQREDVELAAPREEARVKDEQRRIEEARIQQQMRLAEEARLKAESEGRAREQERVLAENRAKDAELTALRVQLEKMKQQTAQATAAVQMAKRKALVIGNDSYKFISKLANAREDAKAVAENLAKVGYTVTLKGTSKNPWSCQILVKYWHLEFNQRPGDEATQCNQK